MSADVSALVRRSPRPQQRGEDRRAALLLALEEELQRHALTDVSISAVTRRAGLGRSAFYFYFQSKHAAVAALLVDVFDEMRELCANLVLGVGAPRVNIEAAIGHTVQTWRRHRLLFCAMLDASAADVSVREVWEQWILLFEDILVGAARDHGWPLTLPSEVDLRRTITALLDLNQRALERHVRSEEGPAEAEELAAMLAHLWTASLFGPVRA